MPPDNKTVLSRPFEFAKEKLGGVDVAVVYCDGEVKRTEESTPGVLAAPRYEFGELLIASNKHLQGYEESDGLYIKRPDSRAMGAYAPALGQWIHRGSNYWHIDTNHHESYKRMERELLGVDEDYVFVPSNRTQGGINPQHPLLWIPEDATVTHEIVHTFNDRQKKLGTLGLHQEYKVADEAVCMVADLSYLSAHYPDLVSRRLDSLRLAHDTNPQDVHGRAARIASGIWRDPEAIRSIFSQLSA